MSGHAEVWARALKVDCSYCGRSAGVRCVTTRGGHRSNKPGTTTREPHLARLVGSRFT